MGEPVSNAIGRVGARSRFGWRVGNESEVAAATTVAVATLGVETTEVVEAAIVGASPMRVSNR